MTYHIVLAEDEQIERDSLKEFIEGILPGCLVSTASNGQEAVSLVDQLPTDIVFMDIQMPGMDGLDAAHQIKNKFPNCEIMFLTAYSEFSYAKEAVDLGASGYLLKPCNSQSLLNALNRMIGRIDLHREELLRNEQRRKNMELLTKEFEEQLVLTVMGGYLRPEWVHKQLSYMDISFGKGAFAILRSPDGIGAERLRGMVNGLCWRTGIYHFSYEYDNSLYVFIVNCLNKDCGNHVFELMDELCRQTRFHQNKRLFCAVSERFDKIEQVQDAFYHAFTSLQNCTDEEPVFRYIEEAEGNAKGSEAQSLAQLIILGERESAEKLICGFLNGLCARQFEISVMLIKVRALFRNVFLNLENKTGTKYGILFQLDDRFKEVAQIEAIHESAIRLVGELIDYEAGNFKTHLMQIKSEIEGYMRANYNRDIFMQQVANEMNYSIAHFCRLFKSCFNQNFVNYLTEMRIKEAKELLSNPMVSIKSIGENVGYKDPSHFTKAFRRIVGISPSEFRASLFPQNSTFE